MFILKKGHQPGVYVPLRALFLVCFSEYILSALSMLILLNNGSLYMSAPYMYITGFGMLC